MVLSIFQNPKLNSTKWGVAEELDKAKVEIAGAEDEFTVAGVNGTFEDEGDVEESQKGTTPMPCTIHSCNGLTDEHAPRKHPSLSFASAV